MSTQSPSSPNSVALVLREVSTAGVDSVVATRDAGSRIGRYVLGEPLDDAGVGALYAARDHKLERQVALRLIPSGQGEGTTYSRARLLRETRSMARVSHPNVIRIFDVGATRHELFIAMELLDGESVREWLDRTSPSWRAALEVFIAAGRGLSAAHEAGFVHGDFDPRYVQRTSSGRVVVTDFGLTRARTRADGHTNPGTDTRLVRDDQYAFCASLYEALFHEVAPTETDGLDRRPAVRDAEVPGQVLRALARGLSRTGRFPSMKALLAALEPPSFRRGLRGIAAAAVFAGGVGIAYALTGLGSDGDCERPPPAIAEEARSTALEALATSSQRHTQDTTQWVDRHLAAWNGNWQRAWTEACRAHRPTTCLEQTRSRGEAFVEALSTASNVIVQHAAEAVLQLPAPQACSAPTSVDPTLDRAWAHLTLGDVDFAIGQLQAQARTSDPASAEHHRTMALLGLAHARADAPQAAARTLGDALRQPGNLSDTLRARLGLALADVQLQQLGRADAAQPLLDDARALAGDNRRLQAEATMLEGLLAMHAGEDNRARTLLADAEAQLEQAGDAARLQATGVAMERGAFEVARSDYPAAMEHFRRAQRQRTEMLGLSHPRVADTLSEIARAWIGQGELVAARDTLETAVEIYEASYPQDHPVMLRNRGRLAMLLGMTGRTSTALEMFESVIRLEAQRSGENSDAVADHRTNRAILLFEEGDLDAAKADLDRALAIRRLLGDRGGQSTALGELANIAQANEDPQTAEALARESLAIDTDLFGEHHSSLSPTLTLLGDALAKQGGRDAEARAAYQRALDLIERTHGPNHTNAAFARVGLGELDVRAGNVEAARDNLQRAVAQLELVRFGAAFELRGRMALAQLEWNTGHRDAALQAAHVARDAAAKRHPGSLGQVDAWLREHGVSSDARKGPVQ